jgi:hypothetical protein
MIDKRVEQRQSFSVFSGGADVIFIDKYFFKDNMTERFRSQLVKFVSLIIQRDNSLLIIIKIYKKKTIDIDN